MSAGIREGDKMKNRAEDPLVEIRNLKKYFKIKNKGMLHAVDDVSLEIYPGV